jgi:hypothetical protein
MRHVLPMLAFLVITAVGALSDAGNPFNHNSIYYHPHRIGQIDGDMYGAIRAVDEYRRSEQKAILKEDERDLDNFQITFRDDPSDPTFRKDEKGSCVSVFLIPHPALNEPDMIDAYPSKLGRQALYIIRKADRKIVRTQFHW